MAMTFRPCVARVQKTKFMREETMKKLATFTATAALAAGFVLAGPGEAMANGDTFCDTGLVPPVGVVANTPLAGSHENVIVLKDAICTLDSATEVKKDVIVLPGGALELRGTTVGENIKAEGAKWIRMDCDFPFSGSPGGCDPGDPTVSVGGNVEIKGTTGTPPKSSNVALSLTHNFICNGVEIQGDLKLEENLKPFSVGTLKFCGRRAVVVEGNLQAFKNKDLLIGTPPGGAASATSKGFFNWIGGDLQVYETASGVVITSNTVIENLQVYKNAVGGGDVTIDDNIVVDGNLQVYENSLMSGAVIVGDATLGAAMGNDVGRDLQVFKNGDVTVKDNTNVPAEGGKLQCKDNLPLVAATGNTGLVVPTECTD